MKRFMLTFVLAIAAGVWMTNEATGRWCMPAAQTSTEQPIRIGGTFQTDIFPCVDETEPCPPCLTIVLASGGHYYLVSDDPQVLAILDTISTGSFAIIEGNHYLEGHYDFIHVTHIFFPETDITQLTGEWEVYKETVSTPTGDADTRWFSTHDVNNTNYIIENNSIYKVVLDQASGYAHYSDIVPYSIDKKENGTWLLTAEGMFSSSDPVGEGIPTPVTIYKLTENEIEWMYAANGGDEGPNYYYQYLRRYTNTQNDKLPSLCDEWNVLRRSPLYMGYSANEYYTQHSRLTSDTVINGQFFTKLYTDNSYSGAMREGTNRDIYYVPAESTHEYLLYAFNAQVGDTLSNLWVEGYSQEAFMKTYANGWTMIVREIQETTPRTYVLNYTGSVGSYPYYNKSIVWLEGVGYQAGPIGSDIPFDFEIFTPQLLCAYNNGEQVYVSKMGEQYGCEYNYNPNSTPSDTIPLFIKDGPGSSTVEPVDPNLIYATLTKDVLSVYAKEKTEISFVLYKAPKTNQVPATKRTMKSASFTGSLSTTLTESGTYTMELTSPAWGYTVFGTFEYKVPQAIENTSANAPSATKILRDGQLLIQNDDKLYNAQGIRLQ